MLSCRFWKPNTHAETSVTSFTILSTPWECNGRWGRSSLQSSLVRTSSSISSEKSRVTGHSYSICDKSSKSSHFVASRLSAGIFSRCDFGAFFLLRIRRIVFTADRLLLDAVSRSIAYKKFSCRRLNAEWVMLSRIAFCWSWGRMLFVFLIALKTILGPSLRQLDFLISNQESA